jgi:uncharacterized membrane protein
VVNAVVEFVGISCIVAAAYLVAPALALLVAGVALVAYGNRP